MVKGTNQVVVSPEGHRRDGVSVWLDHEAADPQERFNLFGQPGTEPRRAELAQQLDVFFNRYADPTYDVWKGGRSKAKLHSN